MKNSLLLFCLMLSLPLYADSVKACVFNQDTALSTPIEQSYVIEVYHWDYKDNSISGVLKKGGLFSMRLWSCNYYGKHLYLMLPYPNNISQSVLKASEPFLADQAQLLLKQNIYESLNDESLPLDINLNNNRYDEFYLKLNTIGDKLIVEIKHYQS